MTGRACLVVEAHDQVVAGSGRGDVEQAQPLVRLDGVLGRHLLRVPGGGDVPLEPDLGPGIGPQHLDAGRRAILGVEPAQHHHGELEPLRGVHGHDAHRVVVGLGQDRLDHPGVLGALQVGPGQVAAQVGAVGVGEEPGLVDHEAEAAPHVAGASLVEPELEGTTIGEDLLDETARVVPPPLVVEGPEGVETGGHGVVGPDRVGPGAPVVPVAARLRVLEQIVVAAAEPRRAERGHDGDLVGGVVDGAQHVEQVAHLGAAVDERARLDRGKGGARRRVPARATAARCGSGSARRCRRGSPPGRCRRSAIARRAPGGSLRPGRGPRRPARRRSSSAQRPRRRARPVVAPRRRGRRHGVHDPHGAAGGPPAVRRPAGCRHRRRRSARRTWR